MVALFSFSQFSCEKLKRVAPSEAVSGFSDGVTTRYYIFFLSVFSLSIYYYYYAALKKKCTTYLYRTITWQQWRHPKSCQNMTRTWVTSAKIISPSSRGQCVSFQCNGHKKTQVITPKTHLVSPSALILCNK